MTRSNLEDMLWALRRGTVDFGAFVVGTRGEYRAMAAYLLRRWPGPEWMTTEDLEQELYLETWRLALGYESSAGKVVAFDPSRGVRLSSWVVFGIMTAAKRQLHKARGVSISGSPDRKPSCFELSVSALGDDGALFVERMLAGEPEAEETIGAAQETRRAATESLRACRTREERYAVLAIREAGSLDGASRVLYDDVDHRTVLRLGSEEIAERFVTRHAAKVARRMLERVNPG